MRGQVNWVVPVWVTGGPVHPIQGASAFLLAGSEARELVLLRYKPSVVLGGPSGFVYAKRKLQSATPIPTNHPNTSEKDISLCRGHWGKVLTAKVCYLKTEGSLMKFRHVVFAKGGKINRECSWVQDGSSEQGRERLEWSCSQILWNKTRQC